MKIPPVAPVREVINRFRRTIFRRGGGRLKELPFSPGDRVLCRGFQGKMYDGTVVLCEHAEAGYANFIRVRVKIDNSRSEVQVNWSLFPDRVKLKEKKDE
tara:strand:+ start:292 stop:591 length:300 start_codon:yes stop_codon:yes gene_type:complete